MVAREAVKLHSMTKTKEELVLECQSVGLEPTGTKESLQYMLTHYYKIKDTRVQELTEEAKAKGIKLQDKKKAHVVSKLAWYYALEQKHKHKKVKELRRLLKARGETTDGKKAELLAKLCLADMAQDMTMSKSDSIVDENPSDVTHSTSSLESSVSVDAKRVLGILDPDEQLGAKKDVVLSELVQFYEAQEQQIRNCASPEEMQQHYLLHKTKLRALVGDKIFVRVFGSESEANICLPPLYHTAEEVLIQLDPQKTLGTKREQVLLELTSFYETERQMLLDKASPQDIHQMFIKHRQKLCQLIGQSTFENIFGPDSDVASLLPPST